MGAFLVRRVLLSFVILVALSFGTFWFFAANFVGPGLHRSIPPLWWDWLKGIPSGRSFGGAPLGLGVPELAPALGRTFLLLAAAFLIVIVLAVCLGLVAAVRAGSALDITLRSVFYVSWALPAFLLALLLQQAFQWLGDSVGVQPFALQGWAGYCPPPHFGLSIDTGPCPAGSGFGYMVNIGKHVALPALALAGSFVGLHARYLRSSLVVALAAPYTTTARAKGLPERTVVVRHALRNSLVTFSSALLLDFASIFGAALAVDWVFKLGGVGTLFLQLIALPSIDPYRVTTLLSTTALLVLAASLLNDFVVSLLDPRVLLR